MKIIMCVVPAVLLSVSCVLTAEELDTAPKKATVPVLKVNVTEQEGAPTGNAAGVLHSFSETVPSDEYVVPLKLKLFRVRSSVYRQWHPRISSLGAQTMVLLSDLYAHNYVGRYGNQKGPWPGDDGKWDDWEKYCIETVTGGKDLKPPVIWDLWNEPDYNKLFWMRSREQWFETWRRGVKAIRSADPKALVTGPSTMGYNRGWIHAFLDFSKRHDVLPDVLNWHELRGAGNIESHVNDARTYMKQIGVTINRIMIPEIIQAEQQFRPGHAVSYMAALHRAGIEASCHSCWPDPGWNNSEPKHLHNNGNNTSLDGLLSFKNGKPRSSWWAFRAYADLSGRMLSCKAIGQGFDGVASWDATNQRLVIVAGHFDGAMNDTTPRQIQIAGLQKLLKDKRAGGKLHLLVRSIPNSEHRELAEPVVLRDEDISLSEGPLTIAVTPEGRDHAWWITLQVI